LALASAVFLDAVVVRCLLLPAVLHILGDATWWFPSWLERIVPRINIEGSTARSASNGAVPLAALSETPSPIPAGAGGRGTDG
jgi:RND superfamily putative drug exporter